MRVPRMNDDEIERLVRDAIDAWLAPEDRTAAHDWLTRRACNFRQHINRRQGGANQTMRNDDWEKSPNAARDFNARPRCVRVVTGAASILGDSARRLPPRSRDTSRKSKNRLVMARQKFGRWSQRVPSVRTAPTLRFGRGSALRSVLPSLPFLVGDECESIPVAKNGSNVAETRRCTSVLYRPPNRGLLVACKPLFALIGPLT
jgi:hypothetical protein